MERIGTNWITDRPPTEADADPDGDVFVSGAGYWAWDQVGPGQTWCHTYYWEPRSKPQQQCDPLSEPVFVSPLGLRVGQVWRTRNGCTATILSVSFRGDPECPVRARVDGINNPMSRGDGWAYFLDGRCRRLPEFDLVEMPRRIISITRTVHEHGHTLDAAADDGTAWWMVAGGHGWKPLPDLPAKEANR